MTCIHVMEKHLLCVYMFDRSPTMNIPAYSWGFSSSRLTSKRSIASRVKQIFASENSRNVNPSLRVRKIEVDLNQNSRETFQTFIASFKERNIFFRRQSSPSIRAQNSNCGQIWTNWLNEYVDLTKSGKCSQTFDSCISCLIINNVNWPVDCRHIFHILLTRSFCHSKPYFSPSAVSTHQNRACKVSTGLLLFLLQELHWQGRG